MCDTNIIIPEITISEFLELKIKRKDLLTPLEELQIRVFSDFLDIYHLKYDSSLYTLKFVYEKSRVLKPRST